MRYGQPENLCSTVRSESSNLSKIKSAETFLISAISIIFDFAFDFLAQLEGHSDYNKRQSSVLIKLFFWKYIITSLFPVLATTDIFDNFLFGAQNFKAYDDFTPVWYQEIGSGLILSMYIRIFLIIGDFIFRYYFPRLLQWYDRGGINSPLTDDTIMSKTQIPNTKKNTHKEFLKVYKNLWFDIERSYAEILNTIFFAFTYWVMLPHIFLPCVLVILTIYYKDKILSKKPKIIFPALTTHRNKYRLDETLYRDSLQIIKFGPAVVIFGAVWIFGNETYISTNNIVDDVVITHDGNPLKNNFQQTVFNNIVSNANLPLIADSKPRYDLQLFYRMGNSTYAFWISTFLIGYIACLSLQ